jgi:prepilin-type N-terminal cleavage/methylation domain-containing protein
MKKLRPHRNSQGFTLLEAMMAMGILSIGLLAMTSSMGILFASDSRLDLVDVRDEILSQFRRGTLSSDMLRTSALVGPNDFLKKCLIDSILCDSTEAFPITIYSAGGLRKISGPPSAPERYRRDGAVCNDPSANNEKCPFEVVTEFRPQCRPDLSVTLEPPDTCAGDPEFIEIFYSIKTRQVKVGKLSDFKGSVIIEI